VQIEVDGHGSEHDELRERILARLARLEQRSSIREHAHDVPPQNLRDG
jgi:hypothetical protein